MGMTIRMGMVGFLALCGLWNCGGTVTHGDSESNDSDTSGWTNGTGGDGSGDFGNNDGSGGTSTGAVGGSDDSASAVTTRGSGSRNNSASSTTSGSNDASAASTSSGSGVSSGVVGQAATSSGAVTTAGNTFGTTISTGSNGFGGNTTNGMSSFNSVSVVTSTTGSGGTAPDLEDFPYLEDCDPSYWSITTQYCSLGFECPSHAGWSNCWDLGNGEFSCDCGRDYFWANYRLSDANTEDACAYAASACVAGSDVEGPPSCTPSYLYQSTNYCNATANCQTKVDVEGADIMKTGSHYVHCEARDEAWTCDCDIADGRVSVTLDTSSGSSDMCVDALDWCSGEITREGPRDCTPSSQYAETNSCYVNLRCNQAAVAGGVAATITESFTLSCRHDDAGRWICDCPGVGSFDVEAETGWDACTLGASECSPV